MKRLAALGGFDAKGPACFLCEMAGARLLLDLGEGPDGRARPDLSGIGAVDAVLISHGHADHVGALDIVAGIGAPPVFATGPVRALARDPRLRGAHELGRRQVIAGVEVETGFAGHAPGAVWMRIGGAGGLTYSGDFCVEGGLFRAAPLPPAAVAILDCSYGAEPAGLAGQRAALLAAIGQGPCLLPAPPAGRGLEIALACLAAGLDVAICDETRQVAGALVADHSGWLVPDGAKALEGLLARARPLRPEDALQGVMVAGGPNCGSGLSAVLGPRALAAGVPILFTGHLSEGSPAAAWVARGQARRLRWNVHPNLATLAEAVAGLGAGAILPAFAPPAQRRALAAALPGPWATGTRLAW